MDTPAMNENPFAGRQDERSCRCNNCGSRFREGEIHCVGENEYCPSCGKEGCIEDDLGGCFDCPKKDCAETPSDCKNPCMACPMENDCYNEDTDKRSDCVAFSKFKNECEQENFTRCNGGNNNGDEPACEKYAENK